MSDLLDAQTQNQQSRDQWAEAVGLYLNSRTAYLIATGREVK
jgi:outer membrane protein